MYLIERDILLSLMILIVALLILINMKVLIPVHSTSKTDHYMTAYTTTSLLVPSYHHTVDTTTGTVPPPHYTDITLQLLMQLHLLRLLHLHNVGMTITSIVVSADTTTCIPIKIYHLYQ
jgi:hypothetical protein